MFETEEKERNAEEKKKNDEDDKRRRTESNQWIEMKCYRTSTRDYVMLNNCNCEYNVIVVCVDVRLFRLPFLPDFSFFFFTIAVVVVVFLLRFDNFSFFYIFLVLLAYFLFDSFVRKLINYNFEMNVFNK